MFGCVVVVSLAIRSIDYPLANVCLLQYPGFVRAISFAVNWREMYGGIGAIQKFREFIFLVTIAFP